MSYTDRPLRSLFTFIQDATPSNPAPSNTWWQKSARRAWKWNATTAQWEALDLASDYQGWEGIAGYWGNGSSSNGTTTVRKLTFQTEVMSTLSTGMTVGRSSAPGLSSLRAGYVSGGYGSSVLSSTDKITFSNDGIAAIVSSLSSARDGQGGVTSGSHGYVTGGGSTSVIDRLSFTNDSMANLGAKLTAQDYSPAGVQSPSAGYLMGGRYAADPAFLSSVRRIDFVTENTSTLVSAMTQAKRSASGVQSDRAGYCMGGYNGSDASTVFKLTFANEAVTANISNLTYAASTWDAGISSRTTGFTTGSGLSASSTIQCLRFSSDVTFVHAAFSGLPANSNGAAGFENLAR
jgi:hypothetical protein